MTIINNSNSVVIVLHEVYGINCHMEWVCKKFSKAGHDVICPNLINRNLPFAYNLQDEAYEHFMNNIGFDSALKQVKQILAKARKQYEKVFLVGYSIGATIAWLCSENCNLCDRIIGYYGSRIRDYTDITPQCPILLIFANEEKSFNVKDLLHSFKQKEVSVHILRGKHGFCNQFSKDYCVDAYKEAERLTENFLYG